MKTRILTSLRLVAAAAFVAVAGVASPPAAARPPHKTSAVALHDAVRELMQDHVTWTRMVIIAIDEQLPGKDAYVERLLQNQHDIAAAFQPFYGGAAAAQLEALLLTHISVAAQILSTVQQCGDTSAATDSITSWYQNADQLAALMTHLNPAQWPADSTRTMWRHHLDTTVAEAMDYRCGRYDDDVADYDAVVNHMMMMADAISDGIVAQFPSRFTQASCL